MPLNEHFNHNKSSLILSSGAYQNPPKHIGMVSFSPTVFNRFYSILAQLFREVIRSDYSRSFKFIVFAIINDHNARKAHNPNGNVQPFAEVFRVDALTIDQLEEKLFPQTE